MPLCELEENVIVVLRTVELPKDDSIPDVGSVETSEELGTDGSKVVEDARSVEILDRVLSMLVGRRLLIEDVGKIVDVKSSELVITLLDNPVSTTEVLSTTTVLLLNIVEEASEACDVVGSVVLTSLLGSDVSILLLLMIEL